MKKLAWKPWHEVVKLREDLRSGELSLSIFAADLYEVVMKKGKRPVYEDPKEFFALTYPTYNLRELARNAVLRLAGKNDKAVHQLELTYGGGKTHALITLYHLVHDPACLPHLPAVHEFVEHIGTTPPQACVAVLPFDKLDVEKGMEVLSPDGEKKWLKMPWSVLAFQLGGAEGLKLLHPGNRAAERESAPAENLLAELLGLPGKDGKATLILIDEVLMYAREKVGLDDKWGGRLLDFFQYLTQAVTRVERCALVASLLATDPRKSDSLGKELARDIYAIFRREREEGVKPVEKEDVAEVLRRRFFTADSIQNQESFRSYMVAALSGIAELDDPTCKDKKAAEERFLKSYPFHPDLTEVFYTKWTNLEGFQRTRGILRTFALALRDAEKWDDSPLISTNVFLGKPDQKGLSEAARELTNVAATEEYEGKKQEWTGIIEGELQKVREIQKTAGLKEREMEQAVFATFLHSQPIGHKAATRDILLLVGAGRPDKIELEKALLRWAEVSWFLDENMVSEAADSSGSKKLPKSWRLGFRPNLKQMHHDACTRISSETIDSRLLDEIGKVKSLREGASGAGIKVHLLPTRPKDIDDDGEFHFAILGPNAASEGGKPSAEARRFLEHTSSSERPRVFKNAVVLSVPCRDGLEMCLHAIRDYLGWEEVKVQLKDQKVDTLRQELLQDYLDKAKKRIPEAIRQAYCIVVTFAENGEIQAFRIVVENRPLFILIKQDKRSRIQDTAINAEALLPGGPYDLWRQGEASRRVKDLSGAFSQFPHLPKMLRAREILDTLALGAKHGFLVLQTTRPDRTMRTFWREEPDEASLKDPALEVVLPEKATLTEIPSSLLAPGELPGLWQNPEITLKTLYRYFSGGQVVEEEKGGYVQTFRIPGAQSKVVDAAVNKAVCEGKLWTISGNASILGEEIPPGILREEATLLRPPHPISPVELLPENLPDAWMQGVATVAAISSALSQRAGKILPWSTVRQTIQAGLQSRILECTLDSAPWPSGVSEAHKAKLRVPQKEETPPVFQPPKQSKNDRWTAEAEVGAKEIQDLSDVMGELLKTAAGIELKFYLCMEVNGKNATADKIEELNKVLANVANNFQLQRK